MIAGAEAPKLDFLPVFDLLGVAVAPLERHFGVGIGIDEHVERAVSVQHRQKGDGCSDLAEYGLDLALDLLLRLLC